MFAKTIIDSDAFLDMPLSAQALYFHLSMRADDDGFLNNAKKIMRVINANQNDYDLLVAKAFIIQFEDGICVIKHWRINNYLRSDRYKPTIYQDEKNLLEVKENGRYSVKNSAEILDDKSFGIPDVHQCETQYSIVKDSIVKDSIVKDSINNNINNNNINNNTPLTPQKGEQDNYDFNKHSNLENVKFVLNTKQFKDWEYLKNNIPLWECIKDWMEYKDAKKPKNSNHYVNLKSMNILLGSIVRNSKEYGVDEVINVINTSMSSSYQGIIWDKIKKKSKDNLYGTENIVL